MYLIEDLISKFLKKIAKNRRIYEEILDLASLNIYVQVLFILA